ncbi:ribonuclease Z [Ignavibacteriales bacterium]
MSDTIKIIFTGSGSGKASLNRFHSSFLIKSDSYNLLVDAGDGISRALLRLGIEYNEIDGILITHFHPDHFSGILSLVQQMKLGKKQLPVDIFVSKSNINFLKEMFTKSFLFEERLSFQVNYHKLETGKKIDFRGKFSLIAFENSHLEKYKENGLKDSELKSYSLQISAQNGEVFYTGDVGSADDLGLFEPNSNSILITETTHVDMESVIEIIKSNEIKKVILTHIDTDDPSALISRITSIYPDGLSKITIAHDGLIISV